MCLEEAYTPGSNSEKKTINIFYTDSVGIHIVEIVGIAESCSYC